MGLDSIVFYGTAAAAMAALAPTSGVIKGNSGDAYIVGYSSLAGTDNNHATLTCPGDPRWEAGGIRLHPGAADATQPGSYYGPQWLPVRVPIKAGATLVATQDGADDFYIVVYVEYPSQGEAFRPRDPNVSQPTAFMISKLFTAGGAVTAFTISVNSANSTDFQRGKKYTPVGVTNNAAMTTPFFVGIQNTKLNMATFWLVPLTPIVGGIHNFYPLPYGLGTVDGGETQFVHFLSTTADTPVARIHYAYA
jgi:hypothetical protein